MMRLIDADKLLTNAIAISNSKGQVTWSAVSTTDILTAPTADVAPVVHGEWRHEKTGGGFHIWKCSRCGRGLYVNPEGVDLYCYHCGAKMDGGDDGETD